MRTVSFLLPSWRRDGLTACRHTAGLRSFARRANHRGYAKLFIDAIKGIVIDIERGDWAEVGFSH